MVACVAPFLACPTVQISYTCGQQTVNQTLPLPLVVAKFCTPPDSPVPKEAFFHRWRTVEGACS
jgi:hypothetical protein